MMLDVECVTLLDTDDTVLLLSFVQDEKSSMATNTVQKQRQNSFPYTRRLCPVRLR